MIPAETAQRLAEAIWWDHLAVYPHALTADRIAAHHQAGR